ncbi:hypothetical protein H2198_004488 [Neophaeococcomyces mojaviensis]|uniref:Uncharacterized protein n=1 Tax=Neophaeococcomyces mojaviensis TaxID=3383035 RepID=A0ACC3A8B5_9EURO|nr:hypothetical protein H2198_004488 [Knufia sp. JES_112]
MTEHEEHFTVFIRLPFARGDFVDPPPVAWSASKERELWEIISKSSKGHEIDWRALSERFDVTQAFLLQQAAWLYERQLSQVRAQMRKMGSRSSNTPSPLPQPNAASVVGGQQMRRTGSGGSRVPSRLSTQVATADSSVPGTPGTPAKGRSSFPNKAISQSSGTHMKSESISSRPLSRRTSKENDIASRTHSRRGSVQHQLTRSPKQLNLPEPESSSEEGDMTQSRMLHRRPNPASSRRLVPSRKSQHARRPSAPQLDEEEDEDSPAFLPFSNNSSETAKGDSATARDPSATLRGGLMQTPRPSTHRRSTSERIIPTSKPSRPEAVSNLTSSASSTSEHLIERPEQRSATHNQPGRGNLPNPLSPHQQAVLAAAAGLSPRLRRTAGTGSDTSPSMGSSFSDLDDASVTQSALEEALLSGMGNTTMTIGGGTVGNVANRVSGISQALRSRYFDARGGESQR